MICWIQECGKYQPCRMFIENAAAVEQHDKVLRKQ